MSDKAHAPHADDHGHGHHGSPFIQHHYDDAQHQFDSGKLGIWLFLAQEVLFFSALFVAYVLYRHHHPEIYDYAHRYLDTKMGAINTAVLIFSSLTAAWAVRCAQLNQKRGLIACLSLTLACALAFLVIKYVEYTHKIHEHILFGQRFDPCVSSNNTPLLTKNTTCPGSRSSVVWDAGIGKPAEGCFGDAAIDQDPKAPGVQAECEVREVKGGLVGEVWTEQSSRPITERCADPTLGEKSTGKYPCWRPAAQPAVCNVGWTFSWTCTGACSQTDPSSSMGPFATEKECTNAAKAKEGELAKHGTPVMAPCTRSNVANVGILVEYGDHELRPELRVRAQCKPAPPPVVVADELMDKEQHLVLGQKTEPFKQLSKADKKELVYSGAPPENTNMFFTIYFAMTGLHGIHVLVGVFVFIWLLIRAVKGHFTPDYFGPIDFAALYWHIVDLIWIFLFPLLYLIH